MGMDVCGKKPTTEEGKYFRNSIWFWLPLADYMYEVTPTITAKCNWELNDGDGLDEADALALAQALDAEILSGRCSAYASANKGATNFSDRERSVMALSRELGRGTGIPPSRPFSVENVEAFVTFLRGCGGFVIW
jgi:hypothetical protein